MGYRRISYWLNEHGYKTFRGHKFKNSHVYSILKKKRIIDERMAKRFEPTIENLRLELKRISNIKMNYVNWVLVLLIELKLKTIFTYIN